MMSEKCDMLYWVAFVSLLCVHTGTATDTYSQHGISSRNANAIQTAELTQLLKRLEIFENRLIKQEQEISELKEKHTDEIQEMQREFDRKTADLKTDHHDDIAKVYRSMEIKCAVNNRSRRSRLVPQKRHTRQLEDENNISFFAKIVNNVHHLGQNQNVLFESVVTNNGNAYNPYLGAFVAPIAGTYTFSTSLMTFNNDSSHYGIFVNSDRITILYVNGGDNTSDSSSQTVVLDLSEQDTVSVRHLDSDKSLVGYHHSMFSGFLVAQSSGGSSGVSIIGK